MKSKAALVREFRDHGLPGASLQSLRRAAEETFDAHTAVGTAVYRQLLNDATAGGGKAAETFPVPAEGSGMSLRRFSVEVGRRFAGRRNDVEVLGPDAKVPRLFVQEAEAGVEQGLGEESGVERPAVDETKLSIETLLECAGRAVDKEVVKVREARALDEAPSVEPTVDDLVSLGVMTPSSLPLSPAPASKPDLDVVRGGRTRAGDVAGAASPDRDRLAPDTARG